MHDRGCVLNQQMDGVVLAAHRLILKARQAGNRMRVTGRQLGEGALKAAAAAAQASMAAATAFSAFVWLCVSLVCVAVAVCVAVCGYVAV